MIVLGKCTPLPVRIAVKRLKCPSNQMVFGQSIAGNVTRNIDPGDIKIKTSIVLRKIMFLS